MSKILLQTTIAEHADDWGIVRFSLLADELRAYFDDLDEVEQFAGSTLGWGGHVHASADPYASDAGIPAQLAGYTLIRDLLKRDPSLANEIVGGRSFLDAVLEPHRCYYPALKGLFARELVTGLAHITGGGIRENLDRILPKHLDASVDLSAYRIPPVFERIRKAAAAPDADMLRTFNLGVGLTLVCRQRDAAEVLAQLAAHGEDAYVIGEVVPGSGAVTCRGSLPFSRD